DQDGALEVKKAVGTIDPRLAIPLAIAGGNNVHKSFENLPDKARIDTLRAVGKINLQPEEMRKLSSVQGFLELYEKAVKKRVDSVASFEPRASVMELLKVAGEDKLSKVFGMLSLDNAFNLLNKLVSQPRPTIDDWQRLHQPTRYNFAKSWHYRIIQLVLALLTLSSLLYAVGVCFNLQAIIGVETSSIIQKTIALLLGGLIVGVWMLIEAEDRFHPNSLKILILSVVLAPTGLLLRILKRDETMSTALLLLTLVFASFIPSVAVLSSLLFLGIFPLRVLLIGWPLLILVIAILWFYGNRKDRKAKNPLMGIMDTKKSQLSLKVAGKV
ncbi:MAG TPA: hypothetical protein VER32_09225, partial [Pyrinomonadaceae bacterium]|nr:hypothetical protein [Pyrinomonadaceae bacterium]